MTNQLFSESSIWRNVLRIAFPVASYCLADAYREKKFESLVEHNPIELVQNFKKWDNSQRAAAWNQMNDLQKVQLVSECILDTKRDFYLFNDKYKLSNGGFGNELRVVAPVQIIKYIAQSDIVQSAAKNNLSCYFQFTESTETPIYFRFKKSNSAKNNIGNNSSFTIELDENQGSPVEFRLKKSSN